MNGKPCSFILRLFFKGMGLANSIAFKSLLIYGNNIKLLMLIHNMKLLMMFLEKNNKKEVNMYLPIANTQHLSEIHFATTLSNMPNISS